MKFYNYFLLASIFFGIEFICSCSKSDKGFLTSEGVSKAGDAAADAVRVALTNSVRTNGTNLTMDSQFLIANKTLPSAVKMAITNDVYTETALAALTLKQLHDNGTLPGFSKDEHGNMTSESMDLVISNNATVLSYPLSRTFHAAKVPENLTNNYILIKQSTNTEWRLQRAWQTDSNGQIIWEWPVQ